MTTGELLVQMSTLTTGTALDHFTNISFGGGGGPCPDPEPCPDCPPGIDCPECPDCPEPEVITINDPARPLPTPVIYTGDIMVIEEMEINVDVETNQMSFGIDVNNEVDLIVNIVPNTLKIDLEWL